MALQIVNKGVPATEYQRALDIGNALGLHCRIVLVPWRPAPTLQSFLMPTFGYTLPALKCYAVLLNVAKHITRRPDTLPHELRHVWQLETNRLVDVGRRGSILAVSWDGGPFYSRRENFGQEYADRPWEIDARAFASQWCRDEEYT